MSSISLNTFRMGQKRPIREGDAALWLRGGGVKIIQYQDYTFRDTSRKCRLRKWTVTHNLATGEWGYAKEWTTQLPGELHYVRAPRKIAIALRMLIEREFPST